MDSTQGQLLTVALAIVVAGVVAAFFGLLFALNTAFTRLDEYRKNADSDKVTFWEIAREMRAAMRGTK